MKNGAGVDIRTIPAIIGGDQKSRHGIVLAKSISAKKYGIRTGEPVANAFRKCPNLKTYLPDHQMYREYSRKLMEFLRTYTTHIEQVSVDECYMDFTEIADRFTSPVEGASEIKDEVYKRFGFTVNVGISSRKVLAKMASDFEKPNKVHTLFPEEVPAKMWPLPIGELFMAGRSSVETMKKLEIYTIGDLANTDPAILELHLKSHGRKLWEFANGLDDSEVESVRAEAKGVGNSTTLPKDLITEAEALPVLKDLAVSVGRRLRKAGQKAGMVSVEIKYHTFNQVSHQKQMERQTNQDQDIYQASTEDAALSALDTLEKKWGTKYPSSVSSWRNNWSQLSTYFKYPPEIRKMIYTTNSIENFNRQLRKVTKSKTIFPSDDSLFKMLYLATMDITKKWGGRNRDWNQILAHLCIYFEDRISLSDID